MPKDNIAPKDSIANALRPRPKQGRDQQCAVSAQTAARAVGAKVVVMIVINALGTAGIDEAARASSRSASAIDGGNHGPPSPQIPAQVVTHLLRQDAVADIEDVFQMLRIAGATVVFTASAVGIWIGWFLGRVAAK